MSRLSLMAWVPSVVFITMAISLFFKRSTMFGRPSQTLFTKVAAQVGTWIGQHGGALVYGGGNTAIDVARTAKRLGGLLGGSVAVHERSKDAMLRVVDIRKEL